MRHFISAAAGAVLLLASGAALAAIPPSTPAEISLFEDGPGFVFKTNDGLAIYSYAKDTPGHSNCIGQCAQAWQPVPAPDNAHQVADWTPIAREGGRQWAYKGKPVYSYIHDTPTSATGDGVGGVWKIVKP